MTTAGSGVCSTLGVRPSPCRTATVSRYPRAWEQAGVSRTSVQEHAPVRCRAQVEGRRQPDPLLPGVLAALTSILCELLIIARLIKRFAASRLGSPSTLFFLRAHLHTTSGPAHLRRPRDLEIDVGGIK
ncbi:uncharacterized protein LOC112567051 isoform X1 [Pomacea canaliculata]|uniref:uncharacterized protein LOC112567051 isoform X1 n=1 Tax=Pomacea canaliculata TaxID=400727 RepID=UPI000D729CBB|nr:uncharacterized protein LOC112567051 isoform X1 [Pomacea canaliculata]